MYVALANIASFDRIGKPTDRNVWEMTADTVNAYYDPTLNMMVDSTIPLAVQVSLG